jgi:hypothetical protein
MQQIGNKKVIYRRTRDIICNTFDYMRITFPFEPLTKIGFLRIYFFNQFSENLNVLSVDIKNWDKHQICIKSKFKNIHSVNLAFYK